MPRFNDHAHALRRNGLLNGIRYLPRQPLLHLQAPRKDLDEPRNLAQADHLALGNVGHVHLAEKRQHVVLAQREHLDVPDDHHLVVIHLEQRVAQNLRGILLVSLGEKGQRFLHTLWRRAQAVAIGIFAQARENLAVHLLRAVGAQSLGSLNRFL